MSRSNEKKTDNHNLAAKVALRKHFLDRYHAGTPFTVLDCCEGGGAIWGVLGRSYPCSRWGVDAKARRGRLAVDSRALLALGVTADVVDVDTYGSPWEHWAELIAHLEAPATVFLTEGLTKLGPINVGAKLPAALGLTFPTLEFPVCLHHKVVKVIPRIMIGLAWEHGLRVVECAEQPNPGGSARYFGVRLEPAGE